MWVDMFAYSSRNVWTDGLYVIWAGQVGAQRLPHQLFRHHVFIVTNITRPKSTWARLITSEQGIVDLKELILKAFGRDVSHDLVYDVAGFVPKNSMNIVRVQIVGDAN
ncbi:hypothetical protein BLJAPNOD_02362 [Ensifer sp. M14]|nr:hypothetical protein BLJAPNOD_02362 [Ensifer sp. M14]